MGVKGQKINPIGWRLGFYRKWKSNWFTESWNYGLMLNKTLKINTIIESFLLYKRFPSLNCNTIIINTGLNKFTIIIFFYNLRVEESESIKKERKKLGFKARFKTLYKLWNFEKKKQAKKIEQSWAYGQTNTFSSAKLRSKKRYLLEVLSLAKNFQGKKKNTKNKSVRVLYSSLFAKGRYNNIKKISNLNWSLSLFELNVLQTKLLFLIKLLPFSNFFVKLLKKLILSNLQYFYNFNALFSLNSFNFKYNLSFIYLYLNSFSYLRYNKTNFLLKKFNVVSGYFQCLNTGILKNSFFSLDKNILPLQNSLYIESRFKLQANNSKVSEYFILNKDLMSYKKLKNSSLNKTKLKNKNPYNRINYKKLSEIKFLALDRKFKRWNNKTQSIFWHKFLKPTLYSFKNYGKRSLSFQKNRILDSFLQHVSRFLYIRSKKKVNIRKSTLAAINNNNESFSELYGKNLNSKSSLIQQNKFFSLNDLKIALENILLHPLDIYFINSVSLLRFQSKFLWITTQKTARKLGFNLLWQSIRLNKINVNRQGRSLLHQPFFIERRNKRLGPFLQDFVLLVLIALITRNFKVLLKFISYQTQMLAKSKRQVPFVRLLIRLISNLGGSLVKIKGLRIQFKGRFDRWNRTKSIIYTSGSIPFQRKDIDIEYGSSHGQVQKGIYGIRLWVWYGKNYHQKYKELFNHFWYNNIT